MTEAEFLKIAREFRDNRRCVVGLTAKLLDAAIVLEDPDPGVEPEWTTAPPALEGWYWARWNGGEPNIMASWWEGLRHCYAPVTHAPLDRISRGVGLEWWPVRIRRPGDREENP